MCVADGARSKPNWSDEILSLFCLINVKVLKVFLTLLTSNDTR